MEYMKWIENCTVNGAWYSPRYLGLDLIEAKKPWESEVRFLSIVPREVASGLMRSPWTVAAIRQRSVNSSMVDCLQLQAYSPNPHQNSLSHNSLQSYPHPDL